MMQLAEDPARPLPWDSERDVEVKRQLFDQVPDVAERRPCVPWGYAGPTNLTNLIRHLGSRVPKPLGPQFIYPVHYCYWKYLFDGTIRSIENPIFKDAWGIHMWGEMLRREPDVWAARSKDSVIEYLINKHLQ